MRPELQHKLPVIEGQAKEVASTSSIDIAPVQGVVADVVTNANDHPAPLGLMRLKVYKLSPGDVGQVVRTYGSLKKAGIEIAEEVIEQQLEAGGYRSESIFVAQPNPTLIGDTKVGPDALFHIRQINPPSLNTPLGSLASLSPSRQPQYKALAVVSNSRLISSQTTIPFSTPDIPSKN